MKHIIIGASAAGITAAKTLRQLQPDSQISLISKDTRVHSRCMLHKLISGERSAEEIDFTLPEFFVENRISWSFSSRRGYRRRQRRAGKR